MPADIDHQNPRRQQEQGKGPHPQQHRTGFEGRAVEHEIAIARHHEIKNLLAALPLRKFLSNLPPKVDCEVGMRRGNGLVLTH